MNKINKIIRHYYNMIEVVLAMGIIAVGMTSIMGLFPVGINASRDAVGYNTSVEMGSNLISYIRSYAARSPASFDALFGSSGGILDTGVLTGLTVNTINSDSLSFVNELKLNGSGVLILNSATTTFDKKAPGIYQIKEASPTTAGAKVYYLLKSVTDPATGQPVTWKYDFAAMAIVWKSPVSGPVYLAGVQTDSDSYYTKKAGLNIEISWPLVLNYNEREKQYFYIELRKPEYNLQD